MGFLTLALRLGLVLSLSAAALVAFSSSPAYPPLLELVRSVRPGYSSFLPAAIFLLLALLGLPLGVWGRREGLYTLILMLFCLPAAVPFSSIDWPGALGVEASWGRGNLIPTLAIFLFVGAGYLLLHYARWLKEVASGLLEQGVEPAEVKEIFMKGHLGAFFVAAGGMLAAGLTSRLSLLGGNLLQVPVGSWPFGILIVGSLSCLLLFVGLYFLIRGQLGR